MFDFESLTAGPAVRSRVVPIPDFGDVQIHELATSDKWEHTDKIAALGDDPDPGTDRAAYLKHSSDQERILSETVARILVGPGVTIAPEKVEALQRNLSSHVMLEIYKSASDWTYTPGGVEDDPLKN